MNRKLPSRSLVLAVGCTLLSCIRLAPAADTKPIHELLAKAAGGDTRAQADCVNPLIDSPKSRWIFSSSACRPFGMVNLSPDTRMGGDWMNGYLYGDTKVRCFSHIHGWQLYGLAVLPVTGEMRGHLGMDTYASEFSHDDEVVRAGYHKLILRTYGVTAELTSTPRVGAYVTFAPTPRQAVSLKVALSYTSEAGARGNLAAELAHWDFDRVARESRDDWNQWLGRIEVAGGTEAQRTKFYTDLWHALLGRRIVSDADGRYCDTTGDHPVIRRARLDDQGRPLYAHHNFDALWGTHWNLNLLWSFAYPGVMDAFCNTMVDMFNNGGLIPRGPSGGNYTFVMTGDPAAPFFAAAYNKGMRGYDAQRAYAGLRKNALPGGIRDHAGYEHGTNASGGGMRYYVERGYVPEGVEGKGLHRQGAGMTLEYAWQDWCLAQFARALGHHDDADWLLRRSVSYTNLWDARVRWMRPRRKDGAWLPNFTPAGTNAGKGFVEANSAIFTHFVPHDMPGLIRLFGGPENYVAALNEQFEKAAPQRFLGAHGSHELAWVDYDNQLGAQMAHLFNGAGVPWPSQKWVRAVKERIFGDATPHGGYNGDEDQGQMGALDVLMAIGLFDVQDGAALRPTYQITSPIFDRVTVHLDPRYFSGRTFTIVARNNSAENRYIQSAKLNGRDLDPCWFEHTELANGGTLELELGPAPNRRWGVAGQPTSAPSNR